MHPNGLGKSRCVSLTCEYDRGLFPRSRLVSPVPPGLVSESVSLPVAVMGRSPIGVAGCHGCAAKPDSNASSSTSRAVFGS